MDAAFTMVNGKPTSSTGMESTFGRTDAAMRANSRTGKSMDGARKSYCSKNSFAKK